MFKQGDFVKVKPNTKLDYGEIINDWAGKVINVSPKLQTCLVSLDAQTLDSLSDEYIQESLDSNEDPMTYNFECNELELSEQRNTDKEMEAAIARFTSRQFELSDSPKSQTLIDTWINEFSASTSFTSLNKFQKENAVFVVEIFDQFMTNYEGLSPSEWTPSSLKMVCLDLLPRKLSADTATFENFGDILISFFAFLRDKKYINNAPKLIQTTEKIKDQIAIKANDPSNWGMAKSMMMPAVESGLDLDNQEELDKFLLLQQVQALQSIEEKNESRYDVKPVGQDPFKGIGRNQKITVRYEDGKIVENIKFKKVKADLKNEKCEIIKK